MKIKRSCLNCSHCKYIGNVFSPYNFLCIKKYQKFDGHTFIKSVFCRHYEENGCYAKDEKDEKQI